MARRADLTIENPWGPEETKLLVSLWMEPTPDGQWTHTVTQIGARLNRTRNSVISRLRRVGAPGRVNPVTRSAIQPAKSAPDAPPPPEPIHVIRLPRPPLMPIQTGLRSGDPCQWLDGDERPYLQCDQPRVLGRPYCPAHHRVAYRPAPDHAQREAAP